MIADNLRSTRPAVKENVSYYQTIAEYYVGWNDLYKTYIRVSSFFWPKRRETECWIYIYICVLNETVWKFSLDWPPLVMWCHLLIPHIFLNPYMPLWASAPEVSIILSMTSRLRINNGGNRLCTTASFCLPSPRQYICPHQFSIGGRCHHVKMTRRLTTRPLTGHLSLSLFP